MVSKHEVVVYIKPDVNTIKVTIEKYLHNVLNCVLFSSHLKMCYIYFRYMRIINPMIIWMMGKELDLAHLRSFLLKKQPHPWNLAKGRRSSARKVRKEK